MLNYNEIYSIKEIPRLTADSFILIDIDDTIITPKSNLFRHHSKYRNIIDTLKESRKYRI